MSPSFAADAFVMFVYLAGLAAVFTAACAVEEAVSWWRRRR